MVELENTQIPKEESYKSYHMRHGSVFEHLIPKGEQFYLNMSGV